ncbi:MAG: hypothetical protein Fur0025_41460 [Oscillatoriaceae cyanobacterium]
MTVATLTQILALVGKLDDAGAADTPRQRFRSYLQSHITEIGQIRAWIGECLDNSGDQYSRALQDTVNRLGELLGFQVTYGRYQGVRGEIGFDGHWVSPSKDFHIVAEVKTSEVYPIKTSALVGYIDALISDHRIPTRDQASGLYIVGRSTPEISQLENSILAERRTDQLRIISVHSLLTLGEMMEKQSLNHSDILSLIIPASPRIDSIVVLMARFAGYLPPDDNDNAETPDIDDESEFNPDNPNSQKRLPKGVVTPQSAYEIPILKALDELGGSGKKKDVLKRVGEWMQDVLQEIDYETLPSSREQRWYNAAAWARNTLIQKGLVKNDSPRGVWEISDEGRRYLGG